LVLPCGRASAAGAGIPEGAIGYVYSTDIVAYIDGAPIDSYNIGGRTAVTCEDLSVHGFRVTFSEDMGEVSIWSPVEDSKPNWSGQVGRPGSILCCVYPSATRVFVNGLDIPSYLIDSRVAVIIEDLATINGLAAPVEDHALSDYLFSFTWDPIERKVNLYSLRSMYREPFDPVCVVYDSITEESVGLDKAHSVYEWFRQADTPQGVAVFTGSDWEAGPVGSLSYGAAHISAMYGKVVCSTVLPRAEEFLPRTTLLVRAAEKPNATAADARSAFAMAGPNALTSWDPQAAGGHLYSDARAADSLTVSREDGSELFSWRWNGEAYERSIGIVTATASAVVVLYADEESVGVPPDGILGDMQGRAVVVGDGRVIEPKWARYPGWYDMLGLEDWSTDRGMRVGLPPGRVWYEIVTYDCICSY